VHALWHKGDSKTSDQGPAWGENLFVHLFPSLFLSFRFLELQPHVNESVSERFCLVFALMHPSFSIFLSCHTLSQKAPLVASNHEEFTRARLPACLPVYNFVFHLCSSHCSSQSLCIESVELNIQPSHVASHPRGPAGSPCTLFYFLFPSRCTCRHFPLLNFSFQMLHDAQSLPSPLLFSNAFLASLFRRFSSKLLFSFPPLPCSLSSLSTSSPSL